MKVRLSGILLLLSFVSAGVARAQEGPPQEAPFINEADLDQELDSANGPISPKKEEALHEAPPPAPEIKQEKVLSNPKKSSTFAEEPFVAPQPL